MKIPARLAKRLKCSPAHNKAVRAACGRFADWMQPERPTFFPEYTNHGIGHVARVLAAADELMTDSAVDALTPEEVAALVVAVVLHDCGMHLTPDGLQALVDADCDWKPVAAFPDVPWSEAWEQFQREVTRWPEHKWREVLGDSAEPVDLRCADLNDLRDNEKKTIGDFLRRHHRVLCHHIALYGVPGPVTADRRIKLDVFPDGFADIVGVISRSHGMDLRPCVDYVRDKR